MTVASERHLIKKYANRKLYDTRTSHYITLDGIADLVRDGHTIEVVDRDSGQDLTQVILSQIVLSEEKRGPARLMDAGADALHDRSITCARHSTCLVISWARSSAVAAMWKPWSMTRSSERCGGCVSPAGTTWIPSTSGSMSCRLN